MLDPMTPSPSRIELVNGAFFDPLRPEPEKMGLEVIAQALANSCRFGGQVPLFYSIAQHSVLVAALSPQDMEAQRCAILHDGDECFGLPDLPTPVKPFFPDYVAAQKRIGRAIDSRFNISEADHRRTKPADRQALMIEKMRLKSRENADYWREFSGGEPIPDWIRIDPLGPEAAHDLILAAMTRVFEENRPVSRGWISSRAGFLVEPEPAISP